MNLILLLCPVPKSRLYAVKMAGKAGIHKLLLRYYSDNTAKLLITLKNKEVIEVQKIEYMNENVIMFMKTDGESKMIPVNDISEVKEG